MFISISYFCKFYKSTYVLLENSVHLLVGVKSKDTTKPKFRRRKDLLLLAASKEDTEVCHKQCCSLQHRTLLLSPVTSTIGFCFCFGSIPSLFLEFFLHSSPVASWAPIDLGSSSFGVISFCFCSWDSQSKNAEVVCHSLFQSTTFCQNSPPCPVCLGCS